MWGARGYFRTLKCLISYYQAPPLLVQEEESDFCPIFKFKTEKIGCTKGLSDFFHVFT